MKSESDSPAPPATNPYQTQWSNAHIPIDPALQQQPQTSHATTTPYSHYPPYSAHYPQAAYSYQYAPPPMTAQPQTQPTVARPNTTQTGTSANVDTADIATLNDALGSAGVDLRAEEETLQRSYDQHQPYRSYEDRSRKQPATPNFDPRFLGATMREIGTQHNVSKIPEDSVNYLALALRARLQDLVTAMIAASHHRIDNQFDKPVSLYEDGTPMWSVIVRSDIWKQLQALERIEREEETKVRRERKERSEMAAAHAANMIAQAAGGSQTVIADGAGLEDAEGQGAKKKRKKEGPGVTARNMSEDVRKKMSNAVASHAAGLGGRYSWMTAANSTQAPKPKPAATPAPSTPAITPATTTAPAVTASAQPAGPMSSWARPYVPIRKPSFTPAQSSEADNRTVVTMRDAMFVVEKERGHGGGRGAALGWS